jgi:hypothetical protein
LDQVGAGYINQRGGSTTDSQPHLASKGEICSGRRCGLAGRRWRNGQFVERGPNQSEIPKIRQIHKITWPRLPLSIAGPRNRIDPNRLERFGVELLAEPRSHSHADRRLD